MTERVVHEKPTSLWLGFLKFLLLVGMTALFYMLAHSMVRHHFFRGALDHNNWHDDRGN